MTDLGPESPDVGIVAIRLSRPRAASRPALADAAGDRPQADIALLSETMQFLAYAAP